LVFLDADTEPGPTFVVQLAGVAERTRGLVSVQPWHRVERSYEQLSAVPSLVAVLGTGSGTPRPRWWRRPAAYGPALAIPRDVYFATGGHGARPATVVDDLALATTIDGAGVPVQMWAGGEIAYRMYGEGPAQLVEGWGKNLAAGAGAVAPLRVALVALWATAALRVAVLPFTAGWLGLVCLALFGLQAAVLLRRVGSFGGFAAALVPLSVLAFVGLFTLSMWRRWGPKAATWRGRSVPERNLQ
jgi:4,4'-diaponeurosporenoate glycosyltransferase